METIKGKITDFPLKDRLQWILDIIYFEGSLLSLFKDIENNDVYLCDWVKLGNGYHRWLFYKCHPMDIYKFVTNKIDYQSIIANINSHVYLVDIYSNNEWSKVVETEINLLPEIYISNWEFEKSACRDFNKLESFFDSYLEFNNNYPNPTY